MTEEIDLESIYAPAEQAAETSVGDETVILHLGSGIYFGLDPVGTRVWGLLKEGTSPSAACVALRAIFRDAPERLESDVLGFLTDLATHDLIRKVVD